MKLATFLDNQLIVSLIFQAKMSNVVGSQVLKCEDFILFFGNDCKLSVLD